MEHYTYATSYSDLAGPSDTLNSFGPCKWYNEPHTSNVAKFWGQKPLPPARRHEWDNLPHAVSAVSKHKLSHRPSVSTLHPILKSTHHNTPQNHPHPLTGSRLDPHITCSSKCQTCLLLRPSMESSRLFCQFSQWNCDPREVLDESPITPRWT